MYITVEVEQSTRRLNGRLSGACEGGHSPRLCTLYPVIPQGLISIILAVGLQWNCCCVFSFSSLSEFSGSSSLKSSCCANPVTLIS